MCWPWASHLGFIAISIFHPAIPHLPLHPLHRCQLVNVSENLSSLSSEWLIIKMMSELGVLKPYPFTRLGDDVSALEAVQWSRNGIRRRKAQHAVGLLS